MNKNKKWMTMAGVIGIASVTYYALAKKKKRSNKSLQNIIPIGMKMGSLMGSQANFAANKQKATTPY